MQIHPFEQILSVTAEELEFELRSQGCAPWANFWLNPRRLRGSDFLMRWSQGEWSEERLIQAVNETGKYFALPYGPSGTAPDDIREFELYFERLERAGLGKLKRPDLLVIPKSEESSIFIIVDQLGGIQELPFTPEHEPRMQQILKTATIAVECENSLWIAKQMPDFGKPLTAQRRLGGREGLKKGAVLPTVIVKEEDRPSLRCWQNETGIPIHIWHAFHDLAFGISFDRLEELINSGLIEATAQIFQAPGGATTKKSLYKIYHHYAYPLGEIEEEVKLVADRIIDKNGHILPYVRFQGGKLRLLPEALTVLDEEFHRRK